LKIKKEDRSGEEVVQEIIQTVGAMLEELQKNIT